MTTARTVQILDSNNNNISPATSIESLYFEMTSKNTRYRMSLRSRFMVADNTIDWDDFKTVDVENDTYMVPFTYVRSVEGTDNTLWQLTAERYDIKSIIENYITRYVDENYIHVNKEKDFFHRNESGADNTISTNVVLTSVKDSLTDQYITLGLTNGKSGLSWKEHNAHLLKDGAGNLELGSSETLKLSGTSFDASAFQYVKIGNSTNSEISIKGKKVELIRQTDDSYAAVTLSGGNVTIDSSSKVNINADMISLSAASQVSIPDNSSLFVYGKEFPKYVEPETGKLKYLTIEKIDNNNTALVWNNVEQVSVVPARGQEDTPNTFYIKNLQFTDNSSVALVKNVSTDSDSVQFCTLEDT